MKDTMENIQNEGKNLKTLLCYEPKGKGKGHHRTGHEGLKEKYRYTSTFSLTSTLDGGGWLRPGPAQLRYKPIK
jgi:hypothetical protein